MPAELGAEFIHGWPNITLNLLRQACIGVVDTGDKGAWYQDGRVSEIDMDDGVMELFTKIDKRRADLSVDAYLREFESDPSLTKAVAMALRYVKGFDAVDPPDASSHAIAEEWKRDAGAGRGSYRPLGGYTNLIRFLAESLDPIQTPLMLETVVNKIEWNEQVRIHVTRFGEPYTFDAAAVILTLPIAIFLNDAVKFVPELPGKKREAINLLAMGPVVKIVLQFDETFWKHDAALRDVAFIQSSGTAFPSFWTTVPLRSSLVIAWAGGSDARVFDGLNRDQRIEAAQNDLAKVFDLDPAALRRRVRSAWHHDWQSDRFAGGAYSYARVGGVGARELLAESLGPLHFAGEACASHGEAGTVAGAFAAGERAARETE